MDRMAEVAPQVQDDFDLGEGGLAELDVAERQENQARPLHCAAPPETHMAAAPPWSTCDPLRR